MNLQYISDKSGNKTAVVVPIDQWKQILQKFKGIERELGVSNDKLTVEEFEQWIENAEKSNNMSLEEFNAKWEQKKLELKNLIR